MQSIVPAFNGFGPSSIKPVASSADFAATQEDFQRHSAAAVWPMCLNCKQSATSVYNNKHACTRCGWVQGQHFTKR